MFVAVVGVVVGVVAAAVVKPKKPLKMRIPNQANRRKTLKKIRHPLWQTPEPLNPSLGPSGFCLRVSPKDCSRFFVSMAWHRQLG